MDFFESQDRARRQTRKLIFFYIVAVALIITAVYAVVAVIVLEGDAAGFLGATGPSEQHAVDTEATFIERLWDPSLFLGVSLAVLLVIIGGSIYRIMGLRSGGGAVAELMGGRRINPSTVAANERKLVNVVEEMAIASGIPVPEIFILDDEEGINAFAAGHAVSDAAIGVTRGCVEKLSRDELQGVVAHEFSHILNGDMRLNIRLIGILNGILLLHIIGFILFRSTLFAGGGRRRSGSRGSGSGSGAAALALPLIGLAIMIIGYIGVFFSRLIQSAVSREREYLADASAVQFTRNPEGLAGALKKIGGWKGSRTQASHTIELSHLFFASALRPSLAGLFSTHPPLEKRIQAIDPSFTPSEKAGTHRPKGDSKHPRQATASIAGAGGGGSIATSGFAGERTISANPDALLAGIGTLNHENLARTRKILEDIPSPVIHSVHNPLGAKALIYGLLLAKGDDLRNRQLHRLRQSTEKGVYPEIEKMLPSLLQLNASSRLPLVDLALPALRQLSPGQYRDFRKRVEELVKSDGEVSLFEFTLEKILLRHLDSFFNGTKASGHSIHNLSSLRGDAAILLSALARSSGKDAENAFATGRKRLPDSMRDLRLMPGQKCSLENIDHALSRFASAILPIKKRLLQAAFACIMFDGKIAPEEGELLRAIADGMDCPMPPI